MCAYKCHVVTHITCKNYTVPYIYIVSNYSPASASASSGTPVPQESAESTSGLSVIQVSVAPRSSATTSSKRLRLKSSLRGVSSSSVSSMLLNHPGGGISMGFPRRKRTLVCPRFRFPERLLVGDLYCGELGLSASLGCSDSKISGPAVC